MTECPIAHINEDDEDVHDRNGIELQGYLNKWTNFLHGWQKRYFVLKNGTLLYFKSELETECGCRGAISLLKATVKVCSCYKYNSFSSKIMLMSDVIIIAGSRGGRLSF